METLNIRKGFGSLLNERYNTPNTNLMEFHFESYPASDTRLKRSQIHYAEVQGKDIYLMDSYLDEHERKELLEYSQSATFSRESYATQESKARGEDPARSMTNKEKWIFFMNPPGPIREIYRFLGSIADTLNVDVVTLPWDLCDEHICASAVATNRVEKVSLPTEAMGQHRDYAPADGIPFAIPVLYEAVGETFGKQFDNGAPGKPWLVSLMIYASPEEFLPEYGMGTAFYEEDGTLSFRADCKNGRLVLFEGDILHSIEASKIPEKLSLWRVSYVFKLLMNPKRKEQSVKHEFHQFITHNNV